VTGGTGTARTYTPNTGFTGGDSFTFKANDGLADSNIATVSITVNAPAPNTPPVASNQSVTTTQNTAVNVTLFATDANGNPLTFTVVTGPLNGSVTGGTGAARTYTPNTGFTGGDSFTFKANDGLADSNIATVTITVNPAGAGPTAVNDAVTVASGGEISIAVLANDIGTNLTILSFTQAAHGRVTQRSSTLMKYSNNDGFVGTDTFTYTITNGVSTSTATVTVTVVP
jgi:hypothetical protein